MHTHIHAYKKVIPHLDSILWKAEKVRWLTSINREEAQHDVGKNKLRSYNTFKTTFEAEPILELIYLEHNV